MVVGHVLGPWVARRAGAPVVLRRGGVLGCRRVLTAVVGLDLVVVQPAVDEVGVLEGVGRLVLGRDLQPEAVGPRRRAPVHIVARHIVRARTIVGRGPDGNNDDAALVIGLVDRVDAGGAGRVVVNGDAPTDGRVRPLALVRAGDPVVVQPAGHQPRIGEIILGGAVGHDLLDARVDPRLPLLAFHLVAGDVIGADAVVGGAPNGHIQRMPVAPGGVDHRYGLGRHGLGLGVSNEEHQGGDDKGCHGRASGHRFPLLFDTTGEAGVRACPPPVSSESTEQAQERGHQYRLRVPRRQDGPDHTVKGWDASARGEVPSGRAWPAICVASPLLQCEAKRGAIFLQQVARGLLPGEVRAFTVVGPRPCGRRLVGGTSVPMPLAVIVGQLFRAAAVPMEGSPRPTQAR